MSNLPTVVQAALERHRGELDRRLHTIEEAVASLASAGLAEDLRAKAERDAHKLAGSLGMFGLPRGSEIASEIEDALAREGGPAVAEMPRLAELVLNLQDQLLRGAPVGAESGTGNGASAAEGRPAATGPSVLVVTSDPELSDRLKVEAVGHGLRHRSAVTCAGARQLLEGKAPDAVVLDASFDDAESDSLDLLEELSGRAPPVPVLVLTASEALVDRVEVARRGGGAFMRRSRSASDVIDAVSRQIERASPTRAAVLAVDDDEAILETLTDLLEPNGLDVTALSDPLRFWEVLRAAVPDVLLLDLNMPGLNGIDLCKAVRADERFGQVPIVFLTAYTDPERIQEIFEAGADDYVSKPIVGPELVTRVLNRLERVRVYRDLAERDGLTGAASRRRSTATIEDLLDSAARLEQPLSFALIGVDRFERFDEGLGGRAGDAVLRGLGQLVATGFGGDDVVGRWGEDEFVVGAYGMTRDDGVQRVAEVLEGFRQERYVDARGRREPASFSAGVAEYPRDGADLQALYRAADGALDRARAFGGDRVLPAGLADAPASQPDVVVVDDDDLLASVLMDSLQTRGYRTERFGDGQEAVDALAGASPRICASLVLLDVDLPGLDGLAVLRRLAKDGVLGRTRVIMLTAHAGEAEVLEALELGAIDHVAKPFSVPVLVQRVRRALRR